MSTPSATLTVWAAAWLAGRHAPDDVLEALHRWAPNQYVTACDPVTADRIGIAEPGVADRGPMTLLKTLRIALSASGAQIRLLLPVPGDVRGVPVGTLFATNAITAGEGVLAGTPGGEGIGLVPSWTEDGTLGWITHSVPIPAVTGIELTLGEAEHSMREAVRDAADAMARLQSIPGHGTAEDPRAQVEAQLAAYSRHRYPDTTGPRARRVLDTADHVAAILTVAQREPSFAPAFSSGAHEQEDLLRPLWDAIRAARLVAVRAAVEGS